MLVLFCLSRRHPPRLIVCVGAVPSAPTFARASQHDVDFVGEPGLVVTRRETAHLELIEQRRDARRLRQCLDQRVLIDTIVRDAPSARAPTII